MFHLINLIFIFNYSVYSEFWAVYCGVLLLMSFLYDTLIRKMQIDANKSLINNEYYFLLYCTCGL